MTSSAFHTTERSSRSRYGLLVAALVLLPAPTARAHQTTCARAQQILACSGQAADSLHNAAAEILRCGDVAPPTIVSMFRRSSSDTFLDSLAVGEAWTLVDRRLADSIAVL